MNPIGYLAHMQGPYKDDMKDFGSTPLEFDVPEGGAVLVMGQASAYCSNQASGNHEVGVVFTLFDESGVKKAAKTACVKLQHTGHGVVCMTYLTAAELPAGTKAKLTVSASPDTLGNGGIGEEDYFSIAVVELEHSVEPGLKQA